MADTDNTRFCPSVTRRTLMTGTLAATAAWPFHSDAAAAETEGLEMDLSSLDPALALWLEWKAACREVEALARKERKLEFKLVQDIGYPCAFLEIPNDMERLSVFSLEQIDELLGDNPATPDIRIMAEAELAAHQARWDAADKEIGWSAVKGQKVRAVEREEALADAMIGMPAMTIAGIAAKLDIVLREGETWEDSSDFPWPQIRSALNDIIRIERVVHPDTLMPGGDHEGPYPRQHGGGYSMRIDKPIHAGAGV
ncbi:hypothetical protein [Rhizobium lusitanum]|uniref:hypothetical protein n=1 Tax=Rhizobium lusitanum TaxID=293958 RepID=UPI00195B9507|nr:hypothetical protein [Rhizobium lusitanum]MBM7048442.1 hypothetical protein [Rhizobium lusitanum]